MLCYICKVPCPTVKALVAHYRIYHDLKEDDAYICTERGCDRSFSKLNSFRHHFKLSHTNQPTETSHVSSDRLQTVESSENIFGANETEQISTSFQIADDCPSSSNAIEPIEIVSNLIDDLSLDKTDFALVLETQLLAVVTNLYDKSTLPRNQVQCIVDEITNFVNLPLRAIQNTVTNVCNAHNVPENETNKITQLFDTFGCATSMLKTEHLRFKYLRDKGYLIDPIAYTIGEAFENKHGSMTPITRTAQYIPLRFVLKQFLELDNVFDDIQRYIESLEGHNSTVISNIIQGELWKKKSSIIKKSHPRTTVLPLVMYFDDYETGNWLGSHSGIHKLGAAYVTLPVVPPTFQGSLENIFLASLFHSSDHKQYGNKIIFSRLIDEFEFLQTDGIQVVTSDGNTHVIFILILVLGDNLGLNTILGFVESFRSNFYCRMCKMRRSDAETCCIVDNNLLRNRHNYDIDVETNNVTLTGIKELCVFNRLPSFHVVENVSVDIMHDLLEGICAYEMNFIFYKFIIVDKLITLEEFNSKLAAFDFQFEKSRPPSATYDNVKNQNLRMSASERLCFCRYACIIFGEMIPEDNVLWLLYLQLRRLLSLLMSRHFDLEWKHYLRTLIREHHEAYLCHVGKLKPKHHLMLHYPDIIKQVGPLVNIWSMRYESKHRESKLSSNTIAGRINICKSLALKHQLKVCNRFLLRRGFNVAFSSGVSKNLRNDLPERITEQLDIKHPGKKCSMSDWVKVYNTLYKRHYTLFIGVQGELPMFGKIEDIFIADGTEKIFFRCTKYHTLGFVDHLCAYKVILTSAEEIIQQSDLIEFSPQIIVENIKGNVYVVPQGHF